MAPVFPSLSAQRRPFPSTGPQHLLPFQTSWCESPVSNRAEGGGVPETSLPSPGRRRPEKALEGRPGFKQLAWHGKPRAPEL